VCAVSRNKTKWCPQGVGPVPNVANTLKVMGPDINPKANIATINITKEEINSKRAHEEEKKIMIFPMIHNMVLGCIKYGYIVN
jgi:hypothetical protein